MPGIEPAYLNVTRALAVGAMYACQFHAKAKEEIAGFDTIVASGDFTPIRDWQGLTATACHIILHIADPRFFGLMESHDVRAL